MAEVISALEKAIMALDSLSQKDITEIRVYVNPPLLVIQVMLAVQTLLGVNKPDWPTAKLLLGDPQFLHQLVSIDKDNLPEKVSKKCIVF